ncbi:MAG: GTP-binding protein [Clostridia bacterium]|nr:GTP-binding protein [Clostridia bacterium]
MVKIDIISGFLGAGKTTLIKQLLTAYAGERVALIENEFGEIGIDGAFLKDSGINVTEINSGCICCSLVGNFADAIVKLIAEYSPSRIIIEPSGVGKLTDIIRAVQGVKAEVSINVVATVVDGGKCKMYIRNFGEFYIDQLQNAKVIVVSKTDKIPDTKVEQAVSLIRQYNSTATILATPISQLDSGHLLSILEGGVDNLSERLSLAGRTHTHADEVFTSVGIETENGYTHAQLEHILEQLSTNEDIGIILRAKGIVKALDEDKWYHFDYVAGDYEIRLGEAEPIGRACVIGSNMDKGLIHRLFEVIL